MSSVDEDKGPPTSKDPVQNGTPPRVPASREELSDLLTILLQTNVPDRELASVSQAITVICAPLLTKPGPADSEVRTFVQGNELAQFVLSIFLPSLIRHLLRPGAFYLAESSAKIGGFLTEVVELFYCAIFSDVIEVITTLAVIFGAPASDAPTLLVPFYDQKREGVSNSQYLVGAIQRFIELEGFDRLIARIEERDHPMPLQWLQLFFLPISYARGYLPKKGIDQYLYRLQDAVFESLLCSPPESLKRMTKQNMSKPLAVLDALMGLIITTDEIRRRNEIFDLSFGLTLLKCPFLDKRIQGINDIKDLIERALKKEEQIRKSKGAMHVISTAMGVVAQERMERISLTPEFLVDWVEKNDICKILLDPVDEHVELIRRSYEIFRLLLSENKLVTAHLDMLWNLASSGKHESVEHLVYDIVKRLAPLLSRAQRDHLLQRIAEKPPEEYDLPLIALVRDFSLATFKMGDHLKTAKGDDTQWLGLKLLYKIARVTTTPVGYLPSPSSLSSVSPPSATTPSPPTQLEASTTVPSTVGTTPISPTQSVINPNHYAVPLPSQVNLPDKKSISKKEEKKKKASKLKRTSSMVAEVRVTAEVSKVAMDYFLELLGSDFMISQREIYLARCIENLSQSVKVPRAITLLSSIIHLYPAASTKEWLPFGSSKDTQKSIIDSLQEKHDLIPLVLQDLSLYMGQIRSLVQDSGTVDASLVESDGSGLNHRGQLRLRAEFLSFLFKNSSTAIGLGALKIIWETLVIGSLCPEETDRTCLWLTQAIKDSSLNDEGAKHLFTERVLKLPVSAFTEGGFQLFAALFLHVNGKAGYLEQSPELIVLDHGKLLGVDMLWVLCLDHPSDVVGRRAGHLLNSLYRVMREKDGPVRHAYLRRCLQSLTASLAPDKKAGVRTTRCFRLVNEYLTILSRGQSQSALACLRVIPSSEYRVPPFDVHVALSSVGLETFRVAVCNRMKALNESVTLDSLELTCGTRRLVPSKLAMRACDIRDKDEVYVTRIPSQPRLAAHPLEPVAQSLSQEFPQVSLRALPTWRDEPTVLTVEAGQAPWYMSSTSRRSPTTADSVISQIISDAQTFDQLFDLLGSDEFAEEVWSLLMILPKNEKYVQVVLDLGKHPKKYWVAGGEGEQLFSTRSMYKLMYIVQIVEDILCRGAPLRTDATRPGEPPQRSGTSNEWARNLIERGFLDHLCTLVRSISNQDGVSPKLSSWLSSAPASQSTVWRSCIALLCRVITRFILLDPGIQHPSVIPRMGAASLELGVARTWLQQLGTADFLQTVLPCLSNSFELYEENSEVNLQNEGDLTAAVLDCMLVMLSVTSIADILRVLQSPEFVESTQCVLLRSHTRRVRLRSARCLEDLVGLTGQDKPQCASALLATLWSIIPTPVYAQSSEAFFLLCVGLIPLAPTPATELAKTLTTRLSQYKSLERNGDSVVDEWLLGCLRALRTCVKASVVEENLRTTLSTLVYSRGLFDLPRTFDDSGSLCHSLESRRVAFALLVDLAHEDANCRSFLLEMLSAQISSQKPHEEWLFDPHTLGRQSMPMGLKNQGATCYMNSLIQQLYMVQGFRAGVFSTPSNIAANLAKHGALMPPPPPPKARELSAPKAIVDSSSETQPTTPSEKVKPEAESKVAVEEVKSSEVVEVKQPSETDILFHQLQLMFAHLQSGATRFYDTLPFCRAFRDYDGRPVNLGEQKDVDEFAAQLFDKLESNLGPVLSHNFQGRLTHRTVSHECAHVSEREEAFYKISLTVKNKKTVQQALELYVEGDLFDGDNKYMCGECKRKVTASKKLSFSELPECLILHLKRFEFDFDTLRKVKVNDYFEFSEHLSMLPYSRTEIDSHPVDYYQYVLQGILIHTGVADGGHYYSFARHPAFTEGWAEFNDVSIRAFHPDMIPKACFGGKQQGKPDMDTGRNAYMLFYTRKDVLKPEVGVQEKPRPSEAIELKEDISKNMTDVATERESKFSNDDDITEQKEEVSNGEQKSDGEQKSNGEQKSDPTMSVVPFDQKFTESSADEVKSNTLESLPPHLRQSVWNKNLLFLGDQQIFSFDFVTFMWQLCQMQSTPPSEEIARKDRLGAVKIATLFTFNVLAHWSDNASFPQWFGFLIHLFRTNEDARIWYMNSLLAEHQQLLYTFLFFCPHYVLREGFVSLLVDIVRAHRLMVPPYPAYWEWVDPDVPSSLSSSTTSISLSSPSSSSSPSSTQLSFQEELSSSSSVSTAVQAATINTTDLTVATTDITTAPSESSASTTPTTSAETTITKITTEVTPPITTTAAETTATTITSTLQSTTISTTDTTTLSISTPPTTSSSTSPTSPTTSSTSTAVVPRPVLVHRVSRSPVVRLVLRLLAMMPSLKQPQYRSFVPYFDLLHEIARTGAAERHMLIANGAISLLLDFFLEPPRAVAEGPRLPPANMASLCALLSLLLRSCSTTHIPHDTTIHVTRGRGSVTRTEPQPTAPEPVVEPVAAPALKPPTSSKKVLVHSGTGRREVVARPPLLLEGRARLLARAPAGLRERLSNFSTTPDNVGFIPLMLLDSTLTTSLIEIVVHWSWNDVVFSKGVIDVCLAHLAKQMGGGQEYRPAFRVLSALVELGDTFQVVRMEAILSRLFTLMRTDSATGRFLMAATKSILALSTQSKAVGEWLLRDKSWCTWLERHQE